ncbi:hypothetical protein [Rossellomorea marisflavi]|uniref:hypothetical protein n=1 Tax=Rossellomorea marisflavi TaxID=189381 RepID=UPI003FA148AF
MFKNLFKKKEKQTQSTFCYCPKCNNELISSNSFVSDEELVTYKCSECSHVTKWLFDAPVPLLIEGKE